MKITIYKKQNCPSCVTAMNVAQQVVQESAHTLEVKSLEDDGIRDELLELVPNARSVPQIFIDDEHVGGSEDFIKWMQEANESNLRG